MTLDCRTCGRHVPASAVVMHREPDDGFAIYEFRCPACGAHGAGSDRTLVAVLCDAGARQLRLARLDRPDRPDVEAELQELRQALAADDWLHHLLAAETPLGPASSGSGGSS